MPINLTDELSTAKERRLNQFGTEVLARQKFDRVFRTFLELNLNSTHGAPSESDVNNNNNNNNNNKLFISVAHFPKA